MTFEEWCARWPQAVSELSAVMAPLSGQPSSGDLTTESGVQAAIQIEAARTGFALWRNNNGALTDDTGRVVRYGLANVSKRLNEVFKSSDLIGIGPHGRFAAVEVKEPGWKGVRTMHEKAQMNFLADVAKRGGIAGFAASVSDFKRIVGL